MSGKVDNLQVAGFPLSPFILLGRFVALDRVTDHNSLVLLLLLRLSVTVLDKEFVWFDLPIPVAGR